MALTVVSITAFGPIAQVLVIVVWALFLFTTERFPSDITALLIMVALILTGLVTPQEGVSGFSNSATLTVLFMFIISAAVEKTGIVQRYAARMFRYIKHSNFMQVGAISAVIGPISGFINNTAAVAIFLPSILSFSRKTHTPATKLLIPLSFISMLGGMLTLFGTSTNILANDLLIEGGYEGFQIFEFFWIGAAGLLIGILYFLLIGRFLLPARFGVGTLHEEDASKFFAELRISYRSSFVGKTLTEIQFQDVHNAEVLRIIRGDDVLTGEIYDLPLEADDVLLILTSEEALKEFDNREHEQLVPDFKVWGREHIYEGKFVKLVFKSNSLHNKERTLRELNFYRRYGLAIIGIHRNREDISSDAHAIGDLNLHSGEVFLAKVPHSQLDSVRREKKLMILEEYEKDSSPSKMWKTLGVLALVIILASFNVVSLMVAALIGVLLLFMLECLNADDIYNSVHWNVIFLLAGIIPLGIALQKTGAVELLAQGLLLVTGHVPVFVILGLIYLITTLTTQVISNNASVVLMLPIALSIGLELGIDPKAVALITMFAASTAFLSPVGYQTNAMVYAAGNYRFMDFIKVGAPLNLILLVVITYLVYMIY